jgi:hypothetical protein
MDALDVFALFVLFVLIAAAVAIWAVLGMLPGRIARQRGHPQAEAIAVCGWWGVITLGILLPLAWIWAYTRPATPAVARPALSDGEESPE